MSYAIFIKMDSITGESRDAKHKGEIDVLSWSWGVTNHPSEIAGKVGAVSGKSSSSDLVFSHRHRSCLALVDQGLRLRPTI